MLTNFFLDLLNSINNKTNNSESNKRINRESKNQNNDINPFLTNKNFTPECQSATNYCPNCIKRSSLNVFVKEQNFEIRKSLNFQSKLNKNEIDKE